MGSGLGDLVGGLESALSVAVLLHCFAGVVLGTLAGLLPGLGPTATIALLIPLSTGLQPLEAIVMLAGIYYGSMYGGSITAILLNSPGEPASVPMALDGYVLARKGLGGPALVLTAAASFIGGTAALLLLVLFAPPLSRLAFLMGPPEYFALVIVAVTILIGLAGRSMAKGLIAALAGLAVHAVGLDGISGQPRLTFGTDALVGGFDFIAVVIGLFAISEVMTNLETREGAVFAPIARVWPRLGETIGMLRPALRGAAVGSAIGCLPGGSAAAASFLAYDVERKVSKEPHTFGNGSLPGCCAAESANNAAAGASFIPLLTLGMPASAPLAVLLGALMIHGAQPGPLLFRDQPEFVWGFIASMYVGNVLLLVLNIPFVRVWIWVTRIPYDLLAVVIVALSVVGAYSLRGNLFDVWVMLAFGVIGYGMRKVGIPAAPLALTLVLAPLLEQSFRQSLAMSGNDPAIFLHRPAAVGMLVLAAVLAVIGLRIRRKSSTIPVE